jgi:hypothetical protein
MIARSGNLYPSPSARQNYFDLLEQASLEIHPGQSLFQFRARGKTVRSVQRLPLPEGKDAQWIKDLYTEWLPRFLAPLIRVDCHEEEVIFSLFNLKWALLKLTFSPDRSDLDRQLLYITGGHLVAPENRGRLEFRTVLNRRFVLAAIHDFSPSLPWFIYKYTQALLHLFVMKSFGRHLSFKSKIKDS